MNCGFAKRTNSLALLGALLSVSSPAVAGEYEALCGGNKCTISITPEMIRSPYGTIPASRVTYWGSMGGSETSVGTGVATTILFGGIGLLGFLAKNHEYSFTVNGFNEDGKKTTMQFVFKNDKPAKRLVNELAVVTGLGMNQTRTAQEITAQEKGESESLGNISKESEVNIGPTTKYSNKQQKSCWSSYLDSKPDLKQWSMSNPAQAEQVKKRFDDC